MEIRYYREDKTHWGCDVEKTEYYCPECGKQEVYEALGEGDYYEGTGLYCNSCNNAFTMPSRGIDEKLAWVGK